MFTLLTLLFFAGGINAETECSDFPYIDLDAKWGPLEKKDDTRIRPYKIKFPDTMVKDLVHRLKNRRPLTPALKDIDNFEYGVHPKELDIWLDYWANEYNFTEREEFFNQYPHYVTDIQHLTIHFMRITPKVPEGKIRIPLLMMHGWPGSVREFYSTIPYLIEDSDDRNYVLDLIMPSLPGFGFSDPAVRPGMGVVEVAVIMRNLMHRLGYKQFYTQGGDWGAHVGFDMATIFPNEVLGYHTNMGVAMTKSAFALLTVGSIYPPAIMDANVIDRLYPFSSTLPVMIREFGYLHALSTKPDSIGVATTDSPSGLFAWIAQEVSFFTNSSFLYLPDGGLNTFTKEELLDNVMCYWSTNHITTSFRIYSETFNKRNLAEAIFSYPTSVPTFVVQAINEILYMPPIALNTKFTNLVGVDVLEFGGHFLAMEEPEVFSDELHKGMHEIMKFRAENNM